MWVGASFHPRELNIEAWAMKEILKHLVESTVLPEDSYLEQDAEILEIW